MQNQNFISFDYQGYVKVTVRKYYYFINLLVFKNIFILIKNQIIMDSINFVIKSYFLIIFSSDLKNY
jgi:hypothetical protein